MEKQTFIDIAKEANSVDDFIRQVREIKNVPKEIAKWFSSEYGENGNISIKKASQNFLNKHG